MNKILSIFLLLPMLAMADIALVSNGHSSAAIVYSMKHDDTAQISIYKYTVKESADRLASYIQRSTGAHLPVLEESAAKAGAPRIELRIADPGTMGIQAFAITFPGDKRIVITGGSSRGVLFGTSEFLERFLGVRWLFPGDLGTEIPRHETLVIPEQEIAMEPSFTGRALSSGGHTTKIVDLCYRWNIDLKGSLGVPSDFSVHHNLCNLVSTAAYGTTHPEFYPEHNGERPLPDKNILWQPCFTAPNLARTVAERLPAKGAYSLGVNDGGEHCECAACLKIDGRSRNFLGFPDRTKSYLLFCNELARMRPDLRFGIPAYADVTELPEGFRLEKNIGVSLAYESIQLQDPARAKKVGDVLRRWRDATVLPLGWYDYLYGSTYCLPRVYPRAQAWRLKWFHENRVRYLFGEYFPNGNWQDCLKIYVWHKIAWDVNADVEPLIDDWCRAAVGEKAAPYFKAYFDRLEKFWTSEALRKTPWFRQYIYLNASDSSFLDAMPLEMVDECEQLLVKTHELSTRKARSAYFLDAFRKSKPTLLLYKKNQKFREEGERMNFNETAYETDLNRGIGKWYVWQELKGRGEAIYATDGGRNDSPALMIDLNGARNLSLCWKYQLPIKPGKIYRITVWCKEEKVSPGTLVTVRAGYKKHDKWMDFSLNTECSYTATEKQGEWRKRVFYSSAPDDPEARLTMILGGSGTNIGRLYFDDIRVDLNP